MLEFGQDISFVALVIIRRISDFKLHLGGKPMSRLVQATWPKYLFSFVTLSKIEM